VTSDRSTGDGEGSSAAGRKEERERGQAAWQLDKGCDHLLQCVALTMFGSGERPIRRFAPTKRGDNAAPER
jgi:hypothetical protein